MTGAKDFTKGPIFKQLIILAMPIMATGFVQMAYNLANMAWVGRFESELVASVGSVGMLIWLSSSFALLPKIASEVSIGQSLGAKKNREAMAYASHTATIGLILGITVALILFFGAEFILSFFRLEPHILEIAVTYLRILSITVPLQFLILTYAGIYNGMGRSKIPFYLTSSGLACNIILDPALIYGIGPIEGMGVKGAAIATCFSQMLVFVLFLWQMKKRNGILNQVPLVIQIRKKFTYRILQLGFPVAIMNLFFSSINTFMARIASIHAGYLGVTTQTAGGQIEGINWNTTSGFSTALGAFVAQNFAANKMHRVRTAYRYTLATMLSMGILISLAFIFWGENIFGLIIPEEAAIIAGGQYLYILGFGQVFMMLEMITQGMFNGMGYTMPPAIVSITFNLARIPLALLLASYMGVTGVWLAIVLSSVLKGIILPIWLTISRKKMEKQKKFLIS